MDSMKQRLGSWGKRISGWWKGLRSRRDEPEPEAALEAFPNRVNHYTSLTTALEHILPTGQLRLSPAGYVNDPLEVCAYNYASQLATTDEVDLDKLSGGPVDLTDVAQINERRNREWNVLCMSLDHPNLTDESRGAGAPFTMYGHGKPAMWAHYAESHRGVCLIFNAQALHDNIVNTFARDCHIKYGSMKYRTSLKDVGFELPFNPTDLVNQGKDEALRKFILQNHKEILLTKQEDWSNEHEFRWLIQRSRSTADYEFVPFGNSLESVVMGAEVHESYHPSLKMLCDSVNANLFVSWWADGDIKMKKL